MIIFTILKKIVFKKFYLICFLLFVSSFYCSYPLDSKVVLQDIFSTNNLILDGQNMIVDTNNINSVHQADQTSSPTAKQSSLSDAHQHTLLTKLKKQVDTLQNQFNKIKTRNYSGAKTDNHDIDLSELFINKSYVTDTVHNFNSYSSLINLKYGAIEEIFNRDDINFSSRLPTIPKQSKIAYLSAYSSNSNIPIGQISSNLFASILLEQRVKFDDYSILFGGFIATDVQFWFGSKINPEQDAVMNNVNILQGSGQSLYLTALRFYLLSNLGHYITVQFDFDANEKGHFGLGNAFLIFGNLDTSNFFVTAGRNKPSVGTYGGGGILTQGISGFLAPSIVSNLSLNYTDDIWNASIALFSADNKKINFSLGIFYANSLTQDLSGGFNFGYIYNLNSSITSFNNKNIIQSTSNTVGAFNVDCNLKYNLGPGIYNVSAGWSTTTKANNKFNQNNQNNNLIGAWYGGMAYSLNLDGKDTSFNATYGQTYNAARVPMSISASPLDFVLSESGIKNQLILSANRAYSNNKVLLGPEYVYQKLYNGQNINTITLDVSVFI